MYAIHFYRHDFSRVPFPSANNNVLSSLFSQVCWCPCVGLLQNLLTSAVACRRYCPGAGLDSEAMKMNPGVPPYMVYHMPMMYGGFGDYSYNPHWGCSIPVMPSPATVEEGKQTPLMPAT
ncbi:uncharacterized protein LOC135098971 isoform X2 [Scylla paramamosain]|uniref:uncharacterized protein LOC135098971 isoform X2 n=1 Tax=Scylla paramamosain TaxID=85552 RepID=UPI0030836653